MSSPIHQTIPLRNWLVRATALLALLGATGVQATEVCGMPDVNGVRNCRAGLSAAQVESIRVAQEKANWCWAASISMVFAHYGYSVPQEGIVTQHFGEARDQAVSGNGIADLLGGPWTDRKGRLFAANVAVADAPDRRPGPAQQTMVAELTRQRPLLIGAASHVMVLVRVDYDRLPNEGGVRITGGTVIDPTPGRGLRSLLPSEARPSYVAAVRVWDPSALALATTEQHRF